MSDIEMTALKGATVAKETEKALNIQININTGQGETKWFIWAPKSQTRVEGDDIFMADWLLDSKSEEIKKEFNGEFKNIILLTDGEVSEENKTSSDDESDSEIPF